MILQVQWTDPLWLASQLYADKSLRKHGLLSKFERGESQGMRQYTELNTGEWWERTEGGMYDGLPVDGNPAQVKAAPGAVLIPIIMYVDGTWLSANGSHTAKPMVVAIGNHPTDTQQDLKSKRRVCFCPDLGGSKSTRNKAAFKRYRRKLQHDLFFEVMRPVREAQAAGGFLFESDGGVVLGFPVMCLFISDTPERQSTSLIFNSAKAKFPCSMCTIPGSQFPNTEQGLVQPLRTTKETNDTRLACLQASGTQTKLKEHSGTCLHVRIYIEVLACTFKSTQITPSFAAVHGEESGFRGLCFGHDHGIHLAAGPDLMHLMLEGLANVVVSCLCSAFKEKGVLSEIDATLANLQVRSHDDNTKFTWVKAGLGSLTRVCAEDMPGVLNSITLALGTYERGSSLTVEDIMKYHRVLYLFSALLRNMKERDHTEEELDVSDTVLDVSAK